MKSSVCVTFPCSCVSILYFGPFKIRETPSVRHSLHPGEISGRTISQTVQSRLFVYLPSIEFLFLPVLITLQFFTLLDVIRTVCLRWQFTFHWIYIGSDAAIHFYTQPVQLSVPRIVSRKQVRLLVSQLAQNAFIIDRRTCLIGQVAELLFPSPKNEPRHTCRYELFAIR